MSDRDTQIQKLTAALWNMKTVGHVEEAATAIVDLLNPPQPGYPARNPVQRAKEMLASLTTDQLRLALGGLTEAQRAEVLT